MNPEDRAAREAVTAVRDGDRDAFARLVELYQSRLYGVALMMTRDPAGADEVTQEAFIRAYEHLDRFDEARPFYPWLATIAARTAQNWLRRRGRIHRREGASLDSAGHPDRNPDPMTTLVTGERDRRLWRAVEALPSGERTAVILHYREGMTLREVAGALGVAIGTVKTQLFRARKRLRERKSLAVDLGFDTQDKQEAP